MKIAIVFLAIVGVAVAQLGRTGGAAAPAGPGAAPAQPNYGPRVFGMGLNNPWAFPPNPFFMQRAIALLDQTPGALLRVDADGGLSFTDRFGQEVDITDRFGNDLSDHIE